MNSISHLSSCYSIFSFICMFCISLCVLLFFFFWPLCCLSFFDLWILITSLVSSNCFYTILVNFSILFCHQTSKKYHLKCRDVLFFCMVEELRVRVVSIFKTHREIVFFLNVQEFGSSC
jgi:hypothetical protein